jgi:SAM-dependent methyltransferase
LRSSESNSLLKWKLLGSLAWRADRIIDSIRGNGCAPETPAEEADNTGRLTRVAKQLPVEEIDGVSWVDYEGEFSHSLWRSQELTLFSRYKNRLTPPILDLGCGDGSFTSTFMSRVDYGVDPDPEALRVAEQYGIYSQVLTTTDGRIPLRDGVARSVFSNSVLEHVFDLDQTLREVARVLDAGGVFVFAVPTSHFTAHVARHFGDVRARQVDARFYHRNMLSPEEWPRRLDAACFEVEEIVQYQPDWMTFLYFAFTTRLMRRAYPKMWARSEKHRSEFARLVATSVSNTEEGGNAFVIARRR